MPIEFNCSGCHKLLRVAITAAGRPAICPDCHTITEVPRSDSPAVPNPTEQREWTTSNWTAGADDLRSEAADNPFAAPVSSYGGLSPLSIEEQARSEVAAPAICLMVTGGIVLVFTTPWTFMLLLGAVASALGNVGRNPVEAIFSFVFTLGLAAIFLGRPILIIYGAIQMKKLQRYPFALTAAILAVISFCSCFLELAFGIWALIVLSRSHVKQVFDQHAQRAREARQF